MQQEWFETFFQGLFVELWDRIRTPGMTAVEVDYLQKAFPPGACLVDIACGNGRHAIELARRGCRVTQWTSPPNSARSAGGAPRKLGLPSTGGMAICGLSI
jgi:hypothetical protein